MGQVRATSDIATLLPPCVALPAAADQLVAIALPRAGLGLLGAIAAGYGWVVTHAATAFKARQQVAQLPAGHLLAGPLPHDEEMVAALKGCRKLLLLRDLRSLLVSRLRAERESGQRPELAPVWHLRNNAEQMCLFLGKRGPALFDEILAILPWTCDPDCVVLHLDGLLQPDGAERRRIDDILSQGLHRLYPQASPDTARRAPPTPPLTPWRFADYWSDEAEAIFTAFGGPQMNRILGYEQPAYSRAAIWPE